MHLADAFIQSDLHCIQVTVFTFDQLLLSLGIEPMILALLAPCATIWATGKPTVNRKEAFERVWIWSGTVWGSSRKKPVVIVDILLCAGDARYCFVFIMHFVKFSGKYV